MGTSLGSLRARHRDAHDATCYTQEADRMDKDLVVHELENLTPAWDQGTPVWRMVFL